MKLLRPIAIGIGVCALMIAIQKCAVACLRMLRGAGPACSPRS